MKKYFILLPIICIAACNKADFLDTRPDPSQVVPQTLADYQAMLDNDNTMNGEAGYGLVPALGETGADNYYVTDDVYNALLQPLYKRAYTWEKDVFESEQVYDWNIPYQSVYMANVVLDGIAALNPDNYDQEDYNKARGSALFYRAHLFYQLAQVFAKPYSKDSADILPGISLRLTSALDEPLKRNPIAETYRRITSDAAEAADLLPALPIYATQPCKAACYGLLARTYLCMEKYDSAAFYASRCLQLKNNLIDYNALDVSASYPFEVLGKETIFQCEMISGPDMTPFDPVIAYIDSTLFDSYEQHDLRRQIFFKQRDNGYYFSGSYSGYNGMFAGIATDEMYLIRAECYARTGKTDEALTDLNTLLKNRYVQGSFIPYTINNVPDVLNLILAERRKELCFRGLRWTDLRRLNKEGQNIQLERNIDGNIYLLKPNDNRYVYPIPEPVISLNPSIEQNIR